MRIFVFLAALAAVGLGACNNSNDAADLIFFMIFHVDPKQPRDPNFRLANIKVTSLGPCQYKVSWAFPKSDAHQEATVDFSKATRLRFQFDQEPGDYWQFVDGAVVDPLDLIRNAGNGLIYRRNNESYDAIAVPHYFGDGLTDRVQKTFQTFRDSYCKGAQP